MPTAEAPAGTRAALRRAYLPGDRCGPGQIHLRAGGAGAPVLLVPDAPGAGVALAERAIELVARGYAVALPDLLGAGGTTCAAGGGLERQSLLLQDVLDALGWAATTVVGDGAGAAVALRLALDRPDRVLGVGVLGAPYAGDQAGPVWTGDEHPHGEHLVALWHELRDGATFGPWWDLRATARRRRALPDAGVLHEVFVDTLPHVPSHRDLGEAARREWADVSAHSSVPVVAGDDAVELMAALPVGELATTARVRDGAAPGTGMRGYVDVDFGQLHVRACAPAHAAPDMHPVLLLHANPGSAAGLEPLLTVLGTDRTAIAVDLPGHGRSDPLPEDRRRDAGLERTYAPLLLAALDRLGVTSVDVYGTHTGAGLACELAILAPHRVRALVLDGVPLFDDDPRLVESVIAEYFLDLTPDQHGSHLVRAWNLTWDMALWWPWFRHDVGGIRDVDAYPTAMLQRVVADMLRSLPTYAVSYRAAWQWPATARLPLVNQPVLVGSSPSDPLRAMTARAISLLPRAVEAAFPSQQTSTGPGGLADQIQTFTATLAVGADHPG